MNSHDTAVLIQLTAVRKTIHELAFGVGILVLGFLGSKWWGDAPTAAAAVVTMSGLIGYLNARSSEKYLLEKYMKQRDEEDPPPY